MGNTITLINGDIISRVDLQGIAKANQTYASLTCSLKYWKNISRKIVKRLTWQLNANCFYEIRYSKSKENYTKSYTIYFSNEEERDAYYKHLKTL